MGDSSHKLSWRCQGFIIKGIDEEEGQPTIMARDKDAGGVESLDSIRGRRVGMEGLLHQLQESRGLRVGREDEA